MKELYRMKKHSVKPKQRPEAQLLHQSFGKHLCPRNTLPQLHSSRTFTDLLQLSVRTEMFLV